jgi:hypothetical protein
VRPNAGRPIHSFSLGLARLVCLLALCSSCERRQKPGPSEVAPAARDAGKAQSVKEPGPALPQPVRLTELSISAYRASLALDEEAIYLLTSSAAYRLVAGQPAQGLALDLGVGATLTRSSIVFWSKGGIWSAPKQGGVTRELAKLPRPPQYFVASGDSFVWVAQSDEGLYTIQTLKDRAPRVLVSSEEELSALNVIDGSVYFVHRPSAGSWRIGRVGVSGGEPAYSAPRNGRRPALLSGSDDLYYYDVDRSETLRLLPDLRQEQSVLKNFVCSPIHANASIFCGCVEGLFEVSKASHEPRVLVHDRPGLITNINANSKVVAWTVDTGPDKLAVDMLPLPGQNGMPSPSR